MHEYLMNERFIYYMQIVRIWIYFISFEISSENT